MTTASPTPAPPRLLSLDALRGFDMFWIIGADALVRALNQMTDSSITRFFAGQLQHKEWDGFAFYDLIFPLFVFLAGVSLVWSLERTIREHGRAEALKRVARRTVLLFLLGIFYSGGLTDGWPEIRLLGVLQRIALAYGAAGGLFCFLKPRALAAVCVVLLAGYWALMTFTPIRDIQLENAALEARVAASEEAKPLSLSSLKKKASKKASSLPAEQVRELFNAATNRVTGKFGPGYNLSNHLDYQFLPGRKHNTYWDPEGMLSTLPAIATCLLGAFAGLLLRSGSFCDKWKVIYLVSLGAAGVLAGFLWGMQFPVVKKIWSSSFVLVAGGYSAMLLGAFYLVVDVWKWQRWCQPFVWMGMNSITIYVTSNLVGFRKVAARFAGGDVKNFLDTSIAKGAGELVIALVGLALAFWFVRFLYQRRIFLRL